MSGILLLLLDQHGSQLDGESLRTFMVEAECIVNSRPLTYDILNSPEHLEPLTPNMILTLKSRILMPLPGNFEST